MKTEYKMHNPTSVDVTDCSNHGKDERFISVTVKDDANAAMIAYLETKQAKRLLRLLLDIFPPEPDLDKLAELVKQTAIDGAKIMAGQLYDD